MSAPTPIRAHVADIHTARGYAYEASAAHIDSGTVTATVRRYKTYDGERRYYGSPKGMSWPLRSVEIAWTGGVEVGAVAA